MASWCILEDYLVLKPGTLFECDCYCQHNILYFSMYYVHFQHNIMYKNSYTQIFSNNAMSGVEIIIFVTKNFQVKNLNVQYIYLGFTIILYGCFSEEATNKLTFHSPQNLVENINCQTQIALIPSRLRQKIY